ncbi:MAG: hypothetical protein ACYDGM_10220 [Vulcanimicrobiaceae bacterium]
MKDIQRRAVAAGFVHALAQSRETLAEWSRLPKSDAAAVGAFIQKTIGLASAPSAEDLSAMSSYVQSDLQSQVKSVQAQDADVVNHTGIIVLTQQS